jgi:SAM-dependent methyltransferase
MDVFDIYNTTEVSKWAYLEGLAVEENFLIQSYLDKEGKTLEAGTGGGRILLSMLDMGFKSLHGFDFAPRLIEAAKARDISGSIRFTTQNALELAYADGFFDQVIYPQQILTCFDNTVEHSQVLREAYRILKPKGLALFSFLHIDQRHKRPLASSYLFYLRILRKLRGSNQSIQQLPYLKLNDRFNYRAIFDRGPYAYWFRFEEACELLQANGFNIIAAGSSCQIKDGRMCTPYKRLSEEQTEGGLYMVCTRG